MRWVETRNENLLGMVHGRAQRHTITIGGSRDGRILAYHLDIVQDSGAYPRWRLPARAHPADGQRRRTTSPTCRRRSGAVLTNTTPIAAYRGAGRPEATAAIERAVDLFAAEIGMDPAEVRRRNVVAPDGVPATPRRAGRSTTPGITRPRWTRCWPRAGIWELRAEQAPARVSTRRVRSSSASAWPPTWRSPPGTASGETSRVVVDGDGAATVYTGSSPHGQGHQTAFAMLVTDRAGHPDGPDHRRPRGHRSVPDGVGTFGSRSLQLGGTAVHQAALEVKEQARGVAAGMIEASQADLELDTAAGAWQVRGDPDTALTWADVASAGRAGGPGGRGPSSARPAPPSRSAPISPWSRWTPRPARPRCVRHITVDDAGTVLNPVLAEGQRHGGIAQGVAQALLEEMRYDGDGNPLTSTLADYAAITATELPSFELLARRPRPAQPARGQGHRRGRDDRGHPGGAQRGHRCGRHLGVRHIDMPATPQRVWAAISEAKGSA